MNHINWYLNWWTDLNKAKHAKLVFVFHNGDVIMGTIASQIISLTIVYSTVYSGADQRKHQSSACQYKDVFYPGMYIRTYHSGDYCRWLSRWGGWIFVRKEHGFHCVRVEKTFSVSTHILYLSIYSRRELNDRLYQFGLLIHFDSYLKTNGLKLSYLKSRCWWFWFLNEQHLNEWTTLNCKKCYLVMVAP